MPGRFLGHVRGPFVDSPSKWRARRGGGAGRTSSAAVETVRVGPRLFRLLRPVQWLALAVLLAIAVGYVGPLRAYMHARAAVAGRRAEVAELVRRKQELARRLALAESRDFIAREARRLGLVKPGERLYIVTGLEQWRRRSAPSP